MKKSEHYYEAMRAVLSAGMNSIDEQIEILETLMSDRSSALFSERMDAERAEKEAKQA